MTQQANKILLISTFRHYFLGIAIALEDKLHTYHAIFIDQKFTDERNPLLNAAKKIKKPFKTVTYLPIQGSGLNKRSTRIKSFNLLKEIINTLKPVEVFTGNDRRLEFQYAINYSKNILKINTVGSYIDDGTGSYIDAKKYSISKYITDRYIDTFIKKIAYGHWYKHPKNLGASSWVSKSYLTFPQIFPHNGPIKHYIDPKQYQTSEGKALIRTLIQELNFSLPQSHTGITLFVLPHSSLIKDMYGSVDKFREQIKPLLTREKNIYIKYHPRDLGDPYKLESIALTLPAAAPAELYLTTLNIKQVIGDISTAMMAAKWLTPDCKVYYIKTKSIYTDELSSLFESIGIDEFRAL